MYLMQYTRSFERAVAWRWAPFLKTQTGNACLPFSFLKI
jgi:hypothetical protein